MVSASKTTFVGWATLLLLLMFCRGAYGLIGDCDNNGSISPMDAVYVLNYLEGTVPPPANYADCDCDGFPGVNIGDAVQIIAHIFFGGTLIPWPGSDLIAPGSTDIMVSGMVNGTTKTRTFIFINNPSALAGGLTLPFSFAAKPGEADLDCIGITVNPVFSIVGSTIDNVGKTFRLAGAAGTIPATANWEVLCEVEFAPDAGGSAGDSLTIDPATAGRYFPLLMTTMAYNGINYKRMLFPRFVPDTFGTIGDVNCDGLRNISDAVYLIAYIFSGGNPPGDPDGDGVPDCPGM
jgi:hypothetical protein